MRGVRTVGGVVGLVLTVGALAGAGVAVATPAFQPSGTVFTALSTTEFAFSVSSSIKGRCNEATFAGTTTSPANGSVSITAKYGPATGIAGAWCRLYFGGTFSATTIAPSASWSMIATTYDALTGVSTGSIITNGGTTFTTGTCVITLAGGTILSFSGTDDTASPAGPGLTLSSSGTGLHYTSTGCSAFGIPATGTTMTTTGDAYAPNVYVQ